mmetsp:Transcript_5153/g.14456  ORF Transcript_5153/g.14456 Transcript_5153/m.14456 type:complete len:249 (-) Transcript_5153:799-1545(-)
MTVHEGFDFSSDFCRVLHYQQQWHLGNVQVVEHPAHHNLVAESLDRELSATRLFHRRHHRHEVKLWYCVEALDCEVGVHPEIACRDQPRFQLRFAERIPHRSVAKTLGHRNHGQERLPWLHAWWNLCHSRHPVEAHHRDGSHSVHGHQDISKLQYLAVDDRDLQRLSWDCLVGHTTEPDQVVCADEPHAVTGIRTVGNSDADPFVPGQWRGKQLRSWLSSREHRDWPRIRPQRCRLHALPPWQVPVVW